MERFIGEELANDTHARKDDDDGDSDDFDDAAVAGARCGTELSANARSWRPGQASA